MLFAYSPLCRYITAVVFLAILIIVPAFAAPRSISLLQPNGGEEYQSADTIQVDWSVSGGWQSGDMVKLDYSTDAGTTWTQIPGAQSLPYAQGSFAWNTAGMSASTQYQIRAACVGHENTYDASDAVFTLFIDNNPPSITHSRLYDVPAGDGPFKVYATVTDDRGIASVKLCWSKNGSLVTKTLMSPTGNPNEYCGDIPGPAVTCDEYRYYIEAIDNSYNSNTTCMPAGAPAQTYPLRVTTQGNTQTVGVTNYTIKTSPHMCGNIFYCSTSSQLLEFSQNLDIPASANSTELRFVVYESPRPYGDGTFTKLLDKQVVITDSGTKMYSSGPIQVHMAQGRSYLIGIAWQASEITAYAGFYTGNETTDFGIIKRGFDSAVYPPPATTLGSGAYGTRFNQSITFCPDSRGLAIQFPTDNSYYCAEPGTIIPITWTLTGSCWQPDDNVRLEYSTNSGTTWSPIAGAENLSCQAGSFNWDTTGYPTSMDYLVRVVWNEDSLIEDRCNIDFELIWDTQAPYMPYHTPLQDTGIRSGPYVISTDVWDNVGTDTVTLYWSLNGGSFTATPMTTSDPSGDWQTFSAEIPGPLRIGDNVCYYIEAYDLAKAHNISRDPENAPTDLYCFNITQCSSDSVGITNWSAMSQMSSYSVTNLFQCTADSDLTQIDQYLKVVSGSELRFVVYESTSEYGTFTKIHENSVLNPTLGTATWHSSGPISVRLLNGRYYMIGVGWSGSAYACYTNGDVPKTTSFGQWYCSVSHYYPPASTVSSSYYNNLDVYSQRISSCRIMRTITCTAPNEGGVYEPGNSICISWSTLGILWESSDTVKLEYSTDSGSTWNAITGASSLPYGSGSFTWNTTGYPQSEHYRVRVVSNSDSSVSDTSDEDFKLITDSTPPSITHTPLSDTAIIYGSYKVSAIVTDNYKPGSATLYWNRNGGDFTSVAMSSTGNANEYSADIPSAGKIGDTYCYYISAVDGSLAQNTITEPSGAPGNTLCFTTLACASEVFGTGSVAVAYTNKYCGNDYICLLDSELTEIRQHLNITSADYLEFSVGERSPSASTFTPKASYTIQNPGTGDAWYSTGPISLELLRGYQYLICLYISGTATAYYDTTGHPITAAIGTSSFGYAPLNSTVYEYSSKVFQQELSSCRTHHGLTLKSPNSGGYYEPGNETCPKTVYVSWQYNGTNWLESDTVRLEYSSDGGSVWSQIPGADVLAYPTANYTWNTQGLPESDHYKVRVIFNADSSIGDASDIDFTLRWDTTPPVITHTPLQDTDNWNASSYLVTAAVTDDRLVKNAMLFYSLNGSAYSSVSMSGSSMFYGYIPGGGKIGDTYSYYIAATDYSCAANTTRLPVEGVYQFKSFAPPDRFTQVSDLYDLNNMCITFTPDGSSEFYSACTRPIIALPTDPTDDTQLSLTDNGYQSVTLSDSKSVSIYGNSFNDFYIGSDGYISFGSTGTLSYRSVSEHFACKRISGLMCNLNPAAGGSVSWKQLTDRVAVTYSNVPYYGTTSGNTFQIEMFFDGRIALSYLDIHYSYAIAGLSSGTGMPSNFMTSDLSAYPQCCPGNLVLEDSIAPANDVALDFGRLDSGQNRHEHVTLRNDSQCNLLVKSIQISKYREDFNDGLAQNWQESSDENWNVVDGQYVYSPELCNIFASIYTGEVFDDFHLQVNVNNTSPQENSSTLIFRATPDFCIYPYAGSGYAFTVLYRCGSYSYQVSKIIKGVRTDICYNILPIGIVHNNFNKLAVNAVGSKLQFFINGTNIAEVIDSSFSSGLLGLCGYNYYSNSIFDDFIVTRPLDTTPPEANGFSLERLPAFPLMLPAAGSLDFDAIFAPACGGPRSADIIISTSDMNHPTAIIKLTGTSISALKCSDLKNLRDYSPVGIKECRVSAVFSDRFYVQDNSASGIGVLWTGQMPAEGSLVTVIGSMTSKDGERFISATDVE